MADNRKQYPDGLLEALIIVAEEAGPLMLGDFNEQTWKMLCKIQARIAAKAADAFESVSE